MGQAQGPGESGPATPDPRGVLRPERLPTFHRLPAPDAVAHLVRWFWIPEWDLPDGRVERQEIIGFPACNLVVEPTSVGLAGPTTRASHRDLAGTGWAVGALLRPAAVPGIVEPLAGPPGTLLDAYRPVAAPDLRTGVAGAMSGSMSESMPRSISGRPGPDARRAAAVAAYADWLVATAGPVGEEARLANRAVDLLESDPGLLRVGQAADELGVSVRTLQRLARRYVGQSPAAIIRRRRLQEAAERLRTDPRTDIAAVAAELGYADHAHLTADFRTVLGTTPSGYRTGAPARRP